ncbi:hypothetical protein V8E53_014991 [Lactarius tabidus]
MTIACPIALKGMGRCQNAKCRLRHDVVLCKPCKRFVLHDELRKHRRGEDHRLNSGFGEWKEETERSARAVLPSPSPYVPKPKPSKKRARKLAKRKEPAGTGGVPARGGEAQHLSVSGEEGLDFKSEVGVDAEKKTNSTIPVIIQKTADGVGLTLVGVGVTGAGSGGFSAIASLPMKIKGNKQRTVLVSFVPTAPGEWDGRLVLRFLHFSEGKRVTLAITRGLHGVATSPVAEPRPLTPQKRGDMMRAPGVRVSQRYPGSSGNMQLRGTRQHRDTGRDSPRSH